MHTGRYLFAGGLCQKALKNQLRYEYFLNFNFKCEIHIFYTQQVLTIEACFERAKHKQEPIAHIITPNQVERVGSTAHFPRVDPDHQPEMIAYRAFLEGFDGGRKNSKVGFMY